MDSKRNQKRLHVADYFKHKKKNLKQFFAVLDRASELVVGHLVDISAGGMKLLCMDEVKEGSILKLVIELPEETIGGDRLTIDARCIWCKQDSNPQYYYSGFEFLVIPPHHGEIIEHLIEEYAEQESRQPDAADMQS